MVEVPEGVPPRPKVRQVVPTHLPYLLVESSSVTVSGVSVLLCDSRPSVLPGTVALLGQPTLKRQPEDPPRFVVVEVSVDVQVLQPPSFVVEDVPARQALREG